MSNKIKKLFSCVVVVMMMCVLSVVSFVGTNKIHNTEVSDKTVERNLENFSFKYFSHHE